MFFLNNYTTTTTKKKHHKSTQNAWWVHRLKTHLCSAHPTPGRLAGDLPPMFGARWQLAFRAANEARARAYLGGVIERVRRWTPNMMKSDEMWWKLVIWWNGPMWSKFSKLRTSSLQFGDSHGHVGGNALVPCLRFSDWFFSASCRPSKPCSISSNKSWST